MAKINQIKIEWELSPKEIEKRSFATIEQEVGEYSFSKEEWCVVRRIIHATANFEAIKNVVFKNAPIQAIQDALQRKATIFCDSRMAASGISLEKLKIINKDYSSSDIICKIATPSVQEKAKKANISRAIIAIEEALPILNEAIILIGNAPLALAALARAIYLKKVKPAAVIAMPVGFVNVLEAKAMILETDVPQITFCGRYGGSPAAVAALHGVLDAIGL